MAVTKRQRGKKQSHKDIIKKAIFNGLSYIIPLVAGCGLLLTVSMLIHMISGNDLSTLEVVGGNWYDMSQLTTVPLLFKAIGLWGLWLVPSFLGAFIAQSISGKPGVAPGFVIGMLAHYMNGGFIGGIIAGIIAGYIANFIKEKVKLGQTYIGLVTYVMTMRLRNNSDIIECYGKVKNDSKNHRVRLVVATKLDSISSYAGTQFGVVERETEVLELKVWKKENWAEEPSPTNPLLNYVALKDEKKSVVVYTRSSKEYEIIGENKSDIAVTLFRSVGHFGLPDLNRRPGRASGLLNKIIEAPQSQMIGDNYFHLGFSFGNKYNRTNIAKSYVNFAVDPIYYQSQLLERVVYPISYFGTNPLDIYVPEKFNLIDLVDSNAIFSTFKKSSNGDSYILRIYNNEDYEIDGGKLEINFKYKDIKFTNILENKDCPSSLYIGKLKPGEIKNIKILI